MILVGGLEKFDHFNRAIDVYDMEHETWSSIPGVSIHGHTCI